MDPRAIERLAESARRDGRTVLLEPEGLELLKRIGIAVPAHRFLPAGARVRAADLSGLPGGRVVVKLVSPRIQHKSAAGAMRVVAKDARAVGRAIAEMGRRFADHDVRGFTVHELVEHSGDLGGELLVGLRWTAEFGPIVVWGLGGVEAERLAPRLRRSASLAITSASRTGRAEARRVWERTAAAQLLAASRGAGGGAGASRRLAAVGERLRRAALRLLPWPFAVLEINPLVFAGGRWLALDVLVELSEGVADPAPQRPSAAIGRLLEPRSLAIVGVSSGGNPGRVILDNVVAAGFDRRRLWVIKPGRRSVKGCRAVADVAALPERVDLLIVALGARRAVAVVEEAIELERAESVIVIAGGLGETPESGALAARLRSALVRARRAGRPAPVVNGANCLGIRSAPGRYDALFLPRHKLEAPRRSDAGVAIVSQSGALLAALLSRLGDVAFRYCISVGNQLDLTMGDYLSHLQDDATVRVVAVYAEGFRPLDGLRVLAAAEAIRRRGGTVVLYRAGRGKAGARAAASHTAAVAGDYAVAEALARNAGVVVADSLQDFEDLIRIVACLAPPAGDRLAVVTNAGFEAVAAADRLSGLDLAAIGEATRRRLRALLRANGLDGVVHPGNPLDLTPMAGDEAFAEAARLVLSDAAVDVGVIGCVPLTPALDTLAPGRGHPEDVAGEGSLARRLVGLRRRLPKPWVAVVDGGGAYEPMRQLLRAGGVPTLEKMDRAVRLVGALCRRFGAG